MRWLADVPPEFALTDLKPKVFWRFHVPMVAGFVSFTWFLYHRGWSPIPPARIGLCALAHLVMYGFFVHFHKPGVRQRIGYTIAPIVNLTVIGVVAESTHNPSTPLWGILLFYAVVMSQAFGLAGILVPAPSLVLLAVGAYWALRGAVPVSVSAGPLLTTAAVATFCYASLARYRDEYFVMRQRLKALDEKVALEEERRRIAREMHDTIGAALTEITLWLGVGLEGAATQGSSPFGRADRRAREALLELRTCVGSLDGGPVSAAGIDAILRVRLGTLCEAAGVRLDLAVTIERPRLDGTAAFHLLRLLSEAAVNAIRHGKPRHLLVAVTLADRISARVEDDGGGFDPSAARASAGRGLGTMRDRARKLGLALRINSALGRGAQLFVESAESPT